MAHVMEYLLQMHKCPELMWKARSVVTRNLGTEERKVGTQIPEAPWPASIVKTWLSGSVRDRRQKDKGWKELRYLTATSGYHTRVTHVHVHLHTQLHRSTLTSVTYHHSLCVYSTVVAKFPCYTIRLKASSSFKADRSPSKPSSVSVVKRHLGPISGFLFRPLVCPVLILTTVTLIS